ncbi:MAG: DNA polymerase III subunit beta [Candidatus Brocadiae bacterium]|nr:DNA polymerase III subunit beta [Candidatus Brocadiia bacterium]
MRFRCKRADLAQALTVVSGAVPARTSMPILSNVRLAADDGELVLTAMDMEMGLRFAVRDVGIQKGGAALLPAAKLAAIVRDIRDEEVRFDVDGKLATIELEGGQFKLAGADPQDFPQFPAFVEGRAVRIAVEDFRDMVRKTVFAVSSEQGRYALTGVLFVLRENEARMVGTDGKRMAYVKKKIKGGPKEEVRVIVPPKGLQLVERIIGGEDEEVAFEFEETQIKAKTSAGMMFARLVEGSYPNYEDVIPANAERKVTVSAADLEYRLRLASNMTDEKGRAVKFSFGKDVVKLFSRRITGETGEASHEIAATYDGPEFDVSFNPEFFLDFLKVVTGSGSRDAVEASPEAEEPKAEGKAKKGKAKAAAKEAAPSAGGTTITLELRDKSTAGVIRSGRDYTYLVMPLTIDA